MVEQHNGVNWVAFENDGRYSSKGLFNPCKSVIQTFYIAPISDDHFLCMYFTQVSIKDNTGLTDAFKKLRNTVIESTKILLSEESTKQKMEVEKAFPNQQYSESLPPYEYELMAYPDENKIMDDFLVEMGSDYVISLSQTQYDKAIDERVKQAKQKYHTQVDQILASHLRFKK